MKLLFRGGTVVSGEKSEILDVLVENERILQVGKDLCCEDAKIIYNPIRFFYIHFYSNRFLAWQQAPDT